MRLFTLAAALLLALPAMAAEVPLGDDGLHKPDWLQDTFKNLPDDLAEANAQGKRLVIMIEQRGCIYCKKVHTELLTDPEVKDFLSSHFMVVAYNLFGDEEVTDLDGEALTEKQAARKWAVLFTPTFLFMPEDPPAEATTAKDAAVAIMPGAFGKGTFLNMFQWVDEKGYATDEPFQTYHARKLAERQAQGGTAAE